MARLFPDSPALHQEWWALASKLVILARHGNYVWLEVSEHDGVPALSENLYGMSGQIHKITEPFPTIDSSQSILWNRIQWYASSLQSMSKRPFFGRYAEYASDLMNDAGLPVSTGRMLTYYGRVNPWILYGVDTGNRQDGSIFSELNTVPKTVRLVQLIGGHFIDYRTGHRIEVDEFDFTKFYSYVGEMNTPSGFRSHQFVKQPSYSDGGKNTSCLF